MMGKHIQLSFAILIMFTIFVLGAVGDVDQGYKQQCYKTIDVNLCVTGECKKMCVRRFKQAAGMCIKSVPSAPAPNRCRCIYHC
ncbi:putative defensin-like protein 150 [Arabidopsis thaliana]|uniref:Putative defensin-like protein 150 n=3 Tax=Arabidopsis TaxID=3701 RepID=DF150_ARATH|nr:low-molecular-weight cysteine-rich 32 [Arabidopsis thaliana]P82747.2 RecName: Full=Putative defensin-like protein 150; AltName: Full=Putative low-molecular-weight cysteine-rich protein 32; Short=Protein LCR32; Flags: Precursor [Arabidopsis thaliana]KAG7637761.1 S locus-related glycoprotein 1 binding pollen coat protein [Arabidopsis thaliana x Arabidopsis arenosa]AEC08118.1 low-molecular-weight cysteine-rich 32 [Arabidopsis thaliana]OAP08626.1 LCR32 [Arabidopsis thaliana]CAA0372869.1 unnamed|eukprot:NP_001031436.1 low-molecular-weight cysteine-rich 32 [Arabidopsis thaliana]